MTISSYLRFEIECFSYLQNKTVTFFFSYIAICSTIVLCIVFCAAETLSVQLGYLHMYVPN